MGDTIDYSYTIERRDGEWDNRHYGRYNVQWGEPVEFQRFRFSWRVGSPFHVVGIKEPTKTWEDSGWSYWEWSKEHLAELHTEAHTPEWVDQHPSIEFSQFQDWQDVARSALKLYAVSGEDVVAVKAIARQITDGLATDQARTVAVMRFVQMDVRYTGIEEGEGAFRPTAPHLVLRRRYGDCKDKSWLAVTMLRALGIQAAPALVSTRWEKYAGAHLASPGVMNHVIVRAVIAQKTYWLDATVSGQNGTLDNFSQAHFGSALLLEPSAASFQDIPEADNTNPSTVSDVVFDFGFKNTEASLSVTTRYLGAEADRMRRRLNSRGAKDLGRSYLEYYKSRYASITSERPLKIENDGDQNSMTIHEFYRLSSTFEPNSKKRLTFEVYAEDIVDALDSPKIAGRTQPYATDYPVHVLQNIHLLMDSPWPVKEETVAVDSPEFHYDSHVASLGKEIQLTYRYQSRVASVPVQRLKPYSENLRRARNDAYYYLHTDDHVPPRLSSSNTHWGLHLLGLLFGVFAFLRLLPYWASIRSLLGTTLQATRALPCEAERVPVEERQLLMSRDPDLEVGRFRALGFLEYRSMTPAYDQPEYVRLLNHEERPISASVVRRPIPEVDAYTYVSFESKLADGRILITSQRPRTELAAMSRFLIANRPGADVAELYEQHCKRLEQCRVELVPPSQLLLDHVADFDETFAAHRADLRRRKLVCASEDPDQDRFTIKGAAYFSRSAVFAMSTSVPAVAGEASDAGKQRAHADYLAILHVARVRARPPGPSRALTVFTCAWLSLAAIGIACLWGLAELAGVVAAILVHEIAHLLAMRVCRTTQAPLIMLPLLGIAETTDIRSLPATQRLFILAAGPITGIAVALALVSVNNFWPVLHLRGVAWTIFLLNSLSLIPFPASDGTRMLELVFNPDSHWRWLLCLVSPLPPLITGLAYQRPELVAFALAWALVVINRIPVLRLCRVAAETIPADADWNTAVRAALSTMAAPSFRRWSGRHRQARAIAIANQWTMPHDPRRVAGGSICLAIVLFALAAASCLLAQ